MASCLVLYPILGNFDFDLWSIGLLNVPYWVVPWYQVWSLWIKQHSRYGPFFRCWPILRHLTLTCNFDQRSRSSSPGSINAHYWVELWNQVWSQIGYDIWTHVYPIPLKTLFLTHFGQKFEISSTSLKFLKDVSPSMPSYQVWTWSDKWFSNYLTADFNTSFRRAVTMFPTRSICFHEILFRCIYFSSNNVTRHDYLSHMNNLAKPKCWE